MNISREAAEAGFTVPVHLSPGLEEKLDRMRCTVLGFDAKVALLIAHTRSAILRAATDATQITFRFPLNTRIYSAHVQWVP